MAPGSDAFQSEARDRRELQQGLYSTWHHTSAFSLQVVKVFSEDGTCRSVEVTAGATARHVCEMLVQKTHALHDDSWSLVELHQHLALGEQTCTSQGHLV